MMEAYQDDVAEGEEEAWLGDEANALVSLGCACKSIDLACAHRGCAARWFAPRCAGVARGRALAHDWRVTWTCACEICHAPLQVDVVRDAVALCKRALRAGYAL